MSEAESTGGERADQESAPVAPTVPIWRRALPFVTAVVLLAWVFSGIDWSQFVAAIERTNILGFAAFGIVFSVVLLLADAFATASVYRATIAEVTTADIFVVRGASYLPTMLNYHLGIAWMTWFMAKVKGASLWRMSGATLIVYATTFGALYVLGVVGAILAGERVQGLVPVVVGIGVAAVGYLAVLTWKPRFLTERKLLSPLFETGVVGQLGLFSRRLPHVAVLFVGTWVPFEFFGVHIPVAEAFGLIPVLMLVLAIPLAPQGFGTRDAVALLLLSSFYEGDPAAGRAAVAACTISWGVLLTLIQLPLSLTLMAAAQKRMKPAEAS